MVNLKRERELETMHKMLFLSIGFFVFLSACVAEEVPDVGEETEQVHEETETDIEEVDETEKISPELTVLAENLAIPWSIVKVNDIFYVSERQGTITKIESDHVTQQTVNLDEALSNEAEAGLLGFIRDPDFNNTQEGYAYYTYNGSEGPTNRIVRLKLVDNEWDEVQVLLDDVPSGAVHHGGRLAIGPDNKLYATAGDAAIPELSQDLTSLAGKILRLNLDGSLPDDNPFEDSYVYSYGHRNVQGLTWTADGQMYASEHGNQANDEVNQIESGQNYGWPIIEGQKESAEMKAPLATSGSQETWAPSGMDQHEETLYVAALRGQGILEINLSSGEINHHLTEYGRVRDVYIEEEMVYFITNNKDGRGNPTEADDRLIRIGLSELE